jgi:hypothetical protein
MWYTIKIGEFMREIGMVTEIKGNIAVIRVDRRSFKGCGRGCADCKEDYLLEVRNLCKARVNDWVYLDSNYDVRKFRNIVKAGISLLIFVLIGTIAENTLPLLNLSAGVKPLTLILGSAPAIAAFILIGKYFRKKPLPITTAHTIAAPPVPASP